VNVSFTRRKFKITITENVDVANVYNNCFVSRKLVLQRAKKEADATAAIIRKQLNIPPSSKNQSSIN